MVTLTLDCTPDAWTQGRRAGGGGRGGDVPGVAPLFGRDGADGLRGLRLQRGGLI